MEIQWSSLCWIDPLQVSIHDYNWLTTARRMYLLTLKIKWRSAEPLVRPTKSLSLPFVSRRFLQEVKSVRGPVSSCLVQLSRRVYRLPQTAVGEGWRPESRLDFNVPLETIDNHNTILRRTYTDPESVTSLTEEFLSSLHKGPGRVTSLGPKFWYRNPSRPYCPQVN